MKIIVLHGDNIDSIYQRLGAFKNEAKRRSWEIRYIDFNFNIGEQLMSKSLFTEKVLYILGTPNRLSKKDINWINNNIESISGTLTIYSESLLNKTFLKNISNITKVEEHKIPVLIWKLLESIYPGNTRNCIKLLHLVFENTSPEFIFALISRHLRDLYWSNLEDNKLSLPSWRISKLRTQARKYPKGKLEIIINQLAKTDVKVKTGKDNIKDSLDFMFSTHLE